MTIPNILTCIRVLLIPVFLVLAYQPSPKCAIWALVVYIVACCTDFVDGYLARKWHQITDFGKFMDPVADKILVLAALMLAVSLTACAATQPYYDGYSNVSTTRNGYVNGTNGYGGMYNGTNYNPGYNGAGYSQSGTASGRTVTGSTSGTAMR